MLERNLKLNKHSNCMSFGKEIFEYYMDLDNAKLHLDEYISAKIDGPTNQ